jgi:hypothetical protein
VIGGVGLFKQSATSTSPKITIIQQGQLLMSDSLGGPVFSPQAHGWASDHQEFGLSPAFSA